MGYKLLLADDSQTIQKVVEIVLNPEGFDIAAFSDGAEAIRALDSLVPDVVLADIEMPKVNGYKLCERIKSNPATLNIPVILLAGAFEPFDEEYARKVGADEYILKPFESHELISKVKSLIMRREIPDEISIPAKDEYPSAVEFEAPKEEIAAKQETQWDESVAFEMGTGAELSAATIAETPSKSVSFDEELAASLQAKNEPDVEPKLEVEPEEISLEEISKMVKEAMGEPVTENLKTKPSERDFETSPGTQEMTRVSIDEFAAEPVKYQTPDFEASAKQAADERIKEMLPALVKESVERIVADTLPNLLEEALRESLKGTSASINDAINEEIRKVVPGLAETIIRREIEKITSELT